MPLTKYTTVALLFACGLTNVLPAQEALTPTPPMGWNSWDSFGTTVTENEVKANADYMAKNLKSHGWQYVIVDIQWSEQNPKTHGYRPNADLAMDANGRLNPSSQSLPFLGRRPRIQTAGGKS
jgi:alpha-galactosidase